MGKKLDYVKNNKMKVSGIVWIGIVVVVIIIWLIVTYA